LLSATCFGRFWPLLDGFVYADDVNILVGTVHTIKENADTLVVASKEIGVEVNLIKLTTWPCLDIRMQDEVTVRRLIMSHLKGWKS
jgi:hypothetical protein